MAPVTEVYSALVCKWTTNKRSKMTWLTLSRTMNVESEYLLRKRKKSNKLKERSTRSGPSQLMSFQSQKKLRISKLWPRFSFHQKREKKWSTRKSKFN